MLKNLKGQGKFFTVLLIGALIFVSYMLYDTNKSYDACRDDLTKLQQVQLIIEKGLLDKPEIDLTAQLYDALQEQQKLLADLNQKNADIQGLQLRIRDLESELDSVKTQLRETEAAYEEAKLACVKIEEKVEPAVGPGEAYRLLWDIRHYAKPEMLSYFGFSKPVKPADDSELWIRAKKVYAWVFKNLDYCRDEGLVVSSSYKEFEFLSPDYIIDEEIECGDSDDRAILFAGLMYASGVDDLDVRVACGKNHCWNLLIKRSDPYSGWYVIDPSCADYRFAKYFDLGATKKSMPSYWGAVDCFSDYTAEISFGPNFYQDEAGKTHFFK